MAEFTQDDAKALDMLSSGRVDPQSAEAMKTKLGVDDDDVKAWGIAQTQEPKIQKQLRTEVVTKVQRSQSDFQGIPGGVKATLSGGAQGATFGFSDEIIAGARAGFEKLSKGGDFGKIFDKKVKEERDELKRLESKYPLQFIAGELTAAVLVPIPGATAFKSAKLLSKVATKGGKLIAEAAVTSAGKAEGEFGSTQFLKEVAKGTAFGAGAGALLGRGTKLVGKLAAKGQKPVRKSVQAISNVLFDLPSSYTDKLLNQRTAQKILNPKSSNDVVDAVVDMTRKMGDHARALSIKATDTLNPRKTLQITDVLKEINDIASIKSLARSNLPEANSAKKAVQTAVEDLSLRSKKFLSEVEVKRFIQDLDKEVPWNKLDWKLKDQVLADIRSTLDHNILKKNLAYKEAMVPVAEITRNLKDISKSFSLKRDGFKTKPSDATFSKVKNFFDVAGSSKKPVTEEALKQAENRFLGPLKPSILEDIELGQIARRTEGGQAAGSRNVIQGLAVGSLAGLPLVGAVAGGIKDKFGRVIGKQVLPQVSGAIDKSDDILKSSLEKIPVDQLERVLRTLGRVSGAQTGAQSVQQPKPTLLP